MNKIDRVGAREGTLLEEIGQTLGLTVIPMGFTTHLGCEAADFTLWSERNAGQRSEIVEGLAQHDEDILNRYIEGEELSPDQLHQELKSQTQHALLHPAFFGSARTGAGIDSLLLGIADLLPASHPGDPHAPTRGTVFKIERGVAREKIAYVRLFSGALRVRDRLRLRQRPCGKGHRDREFQSPLWRCVLGCYGRQHREGLGTSLTSRSATGSGSSERTKYISNLLCQLWRRSSKRMMSLTGLDRTALTELTEQDPLISVRQDEDLNEITVSLYGEVQKEVIQSTLANDYQIELDFRETTTVYIERLVGIGEAVEFLTSDANPYMATIGLRVEPGRLHQGSSSRSMLITDRYRCSYLRRRRDSSTT